jgi:hypothetical protein
MENWELSHSATPELLISSPLFFRNYRIAENPDFLDFYFHEIPGSEVLRRIHGHTHTLGCSRQNDSTRIKSGASAEEFDQRRYIKQHVRSV